MNSAKSYFLAPVSCFCAYACFAAIICGFTQNAEAEERITTFSELLKFGLSHSYDAAASKADIRAQEKNREAVRSAINVPQVDLGASYQSWSYQNPYDKGVGASISNNGTNPIVSLTVTYDLQKIFGPDSALASQAEYAAKIQAKIVQRETVRSIKKAYFYLLASKTEILELKKQIELFGKVDKILQKQKALGVFNSLERQQFQIQQGLLEAELQAKLNDLDAAYSALSTNLHMNLVDTKRTADLISDQPPLRYAAKVTLDPQTLSQQSDADVLQNFSRDYDAAKLEYEKYPSIALPQVFLKTGHEAPTMPSGDGPQSFVEVGLSFPLSGFVSRPPAKESLAARSERNRALLDKALFEYHNQIFSVSQSLSRLNADVIRLRTLRDETQKLQGRSFTYFSQKRLDALGTLDIFAKSLQASRLVLNEELQIKNLDSDLEYLLGGSGL